MNRFFNGTLALGGVVVLRCGVPSELNFDEVSANEPDYLGGAIQSALEGQKPPMTFIVVTPDSKLKFCPVQEDAATFGGYAAPGTVVSSAVTKKNAEDAYLQPHAGIQGTASTTYVRVGQNDLQLSMEDQEELFNDLCYLYPKCNRAGLSCLRLQFRLFLCETPVLVHSQSRCRCIANSQNRQQSADASGLQVAVSKHASSQMRKLRCAPMMPLGGCAAASSQRKAQSIW